MFLHLSARPPTCAPLLFKSLSQSPALWAFFTLLQLIHALHPPRQSQRPTVTWWHEWLPVPYSCPVDQRQYTHTHTYRTNKPHCCRHFTQTHLCLCFLNTSDFLESWHVEILNFFGWTWQALLNKQMWPWSTKPVLSCWGIFVAIAKSTLYGSKW